MPQYLVCHDYGTGGLWWWINALSSGDIIDRYRDVTVFERPPGWWREDLDKTVERRNLGDPDTPPLAALRRKADCSYRPHS